MRRAAGVLVLAWVVCLAIGWSTPGAAGPSRPAAPAGLHPVRDAIEA